MQVALLISLIMLCTGGCIASTYEVEAKKRGWPVSPYYQLYGVMTTIGTIFTLGSIIISFVSNPWWTGIIVIIAGLILKIGRAHV